MPFKSKAQIEAERLANASIIPTEGNESPVTEKKEKKLDVAADIKTKRELYEKDLELIEKDKEIQKLRDELQNGLDRIKTAAPDLDVINSLQAQVNLLSAQVLGASQGKKLMFRQPVATDILPDRESVTFTARSVIYIVASYIDSQGLEKLPPHKLIVFNYAASDIRKEGREEEIKNFSQYTTNLITEIEFLRSHPFYGITFSENTNEMMNEDVKETQFKVRASLQISTMSPEDVYARANEFSIPNWRKKAASELKPLVLNHMVAQYKKEERALQEDLLRRQTLGQLVSSEKE
jgi:hypothetical protein